MLLAEKTLEKLGYYPESLSVGSNKAIILQCDYCQKEYKSSNKRRKVSHKKMDTDACKQCKYAKREAIELRDYGCTNPGARKEVKDKIKATNQKRYGVDYATQIDGFKDKAKATNLKKYGSVNAMQSKKVQEKHKQVIRDKYGVDNVSEIEEVQKKRRQTCKKKFGSETFMSSEIGRKKLQDGVQKKYGVKNVFQAEEIKEKIKLTSIKKYGVDHHLKNEDIVNKIIQSKINNGQITTYQGKTRKQWSKDLDKSYFTFNRHVREFGFEHAIKIPQYTNGLEEIVRIWLEDNNIKYDQGFIIDGRKTDFLLSDYNIILECDGLYYHSDKIMKDNKYHLIKQKVYSDNGFISLFFREDEIKKKLNIVTSIIKNKMKESNKIYGRKCIYKMVEKKEAKEFLENNHLMGKGSGDSYGLFYDNKLITILQTRRLKNKDYEIARFCNKIGHSVIGGFTKLLTKFETNKNPDSVLTYIDKRYGDGSYLSKLGFNYKSNNLSFCWVRALDRVHRMKFPGNSGYENGYYKIWDCGQTKYVKEYNV